MQSAINKKSKGLDSNVVPHFNETALALPFRQDVLSSTFCFSCSKFSGKSVSVTLPLKQLLFIHKLYLISKYF